MTNDETQPPPYLQDHFADLIDPRFVVPDYRRMMEPYHTLENSEAGVRHQTRIELDAPLRLWLRALALFRTPFSGRFEWPEDLPDQSKHALDLREDLLALAGGASKPTLDALIDGYYWSAFGMIRSLLETCARVGFLRNRPAEALPYFEPPTESPIGPDGKPKKDRPRALSLRTIVKAYAEASEERETFNHIHAGIVQMHPGSHPSPEGILQVYLQEGRKAFGPVYHRYWASFGLKWGIFANLVLLAELEALQWQDQAWDSDYRSLTHSFQSWQEAYNEEFVDNDRVPTEGL